MHRNCHITIDRIADINHLRYSFHHAKKGKNSYKSVKVTSAHLEDRLQLLREMILSGNYHTSVYRNETICDRGKERVISKLPFYPDRILQSALISSFESTYLDHLDIDTHSALPGRGVESAFNRLKFFLTHYPTKTQYCLKIDLRHYFESIDRTKIFTEITKFSKDTRITSIYKDIIFSYEKGLPIGNYTSQYLANLFLRKIDNIIKSKGYLFSRYMDDIVILSHSKKLLRNIFLYLNNLFSHEYLLTIKSNYQIFPVDVRGIDYVGYRFYHNRILLRKTILKRLRRTCKNILSKPILSVRNRSRFSSYYGMVKRCSIFIRDHIYNLHFSEIVIKFKLQLSYYG